MVRMDDSILELYKSGLISKDTALSYADHPELLEKHLI
jgi:Tfp pilus assembly pilus retraction ATPase PilT